MKVVIAVLALIIPVYSQFRADPSSYVLEQYQNLNGVDGSYSHVYRTSNGISAEESGVGGQYAQGSYSFIGDDGQPVALSYIADEFGYRPSSSSLPQPPPIPDYILRSLAYIRSVQGNFVKK